MKIEELPAFMLQEMLLDNPDDCIYVTLVGKHIESLIPYYTIYGMDYSISGRYINRKMVIPT